MKAKIHPAYNDTVIVKCSCGNSFTTGSTEEMLEVEVCSACHPFYTGKQKLIDVAGRVDKFKDRLKKEQALRQIRQAHSRQGQGKPKKTRPNKKKDDVIKL